MMRMIIITTTTSNDGDDAKINEPASKLKVSWRLQASPRLPWGTSRPLTYTTADE